jgi:molybdate transport system substrate-binding protein
MTARRRLLASLAAGAATLAVPRAPLHAQGVPTVAAASDLKFALEEVAARFEWATGHRLRLVFGSSGNFCSQILQGAPFQMFAARR